MGKRVAFRILVVLAVLAPGAVPVLSISVASTFCPSHAAGPPRPLSPKANYEARTNRIDLADKGIVPLRRFSSHWRMYAGPEGRPIWAKLGGVVVGGRMDSPFFHCNSYLNLDSLPSLRQRTVIFQALAASTSAPASSNDPTPTPETHLQPNHLRLQD
ncbi:hypothetical protein GALMADRAFT_146502 [Galerina marginata CBS 339.88]|uniref:Uncharacterized protein n=1 Tax=Galerina marginata (strain CBS 339.88) TaxID=685588 RepID=A0A067SBM6_GALM3|nr:hypothetical protein GALMADRAFT_146502 [Galerina marginata CBS 339.88]